ncbi:hypothetical protein OIU79_024718 [Salix purpurea]|uniref:Uncharacterized protein n=1 Tax=Salix purpurea TaxID=77065 RepID=A0A9Q0W3W2_SALPP|nr:hypothetical protein OIU79_024718 [Salix purpurea]
MNVLAVLLHPLPLHLHF